VDDNGTKKPVVMVKGAVASLMRVTAGRMQQEPGVPVVGAGSTASLRLEGTTLGPGAPQTPQITIVRGAKVGH
jgi:hypothetical protein